MSAVLVSIVVSTVVIAFSVARSQIWLIVYEICRSFINAIFSLNTASFTSMLSSLCVSILMHALLRAIAVELCTVFDAAPNYLSMSSLISVSKSFIVYLMLVRFFVNLEYKSVNLPFFRWQVSCWAVFPLTSCQVFPSLCPIHQELYHSHVSIRSQSHVWPWR